MAQQHAHHGLLDSRHSVSLALVFIAVVMKSYKQSRFIRRDAYAEVLRLIPNT
jgi:hypothetical protein